MNFETALLHAVEAHDGQTDKSGRPYLLHVVRVGFAARKFSEDHGVVGLLHDVIEDTDHELPRHPYDMTHLKQEYSDDKLTVVQVEALRALTRKEGEPYFVYIERLIDESALAVLVKLLDNKDNTKADRRDDAFWNAEMEDRYSRARKMLIAEVQSWHNFDLPMGSL